MTCSRAVSEATPCARRASSKLWVAREDTPAPEGQRDLTGALEACHQAEAKQERRANQDAANADGHADLAYSQSRIAEIAAKRGQ
ncbi:MAG: hypothetical protein P4M00_06105 [Azospirillaceae bacterium]|nr:hypothetical protein [Azospirillaceae bacterium]